MDWEFSAFGTPKSKAPRWEALGAGTTGHIRGWKIYEQQLAGVADATAVIEAPQLFQLLASKRIEAALYERWMGLALMRQMNIHGFIAHSPPLAKREMFIYLHKRHARHVPLLAKALVDMKAEGFYRMAYQKSLAPYLTPAQY
jgi:polar amino acid transport system substrate-binding protein